MQAMTAVSMICGPGLHKMLFALLCCSPFQSRIIPRAVWGKNLSNLWTQLGYLRDGEELPYIRAVTLRLPPSLNSEMGWTVQCSGQILISLNGKTKIRIVFVLFIFAQKNPIFLMDILDFIWIMFNVSINFSDFNRTKRYGPLGGPTSSSCGGLWPLATAFFALWGKKDLIILFWPWQLLVETLVTLKEIPKKTKKYKN